MSHVHTPLRSQRLRLVNHQGDALVSRDIMAAMVEIHALGHPHDGMVLVSGNDKSVPAHLVAMARCDLPAIHLPGGTQLNAPDYMTSDNMWPMGAGVERGDLPKEDLELAQRGACPPAAPASSWAARAPARCSPRRWAWRCPGRR